VDPSKSKSIGGFKVIISEVNSGKKADYSLSGTVLTVEGVAIDLQDRQDSVQKVIDISLDGNMKAREGVGAWYVATVILPAKQRELYDTGELDENENQVMAERDLPLDMSKVELRLWGLPENYSQVAEGEVL
jgi:hypothetical protein